MQKLKSRFSDGSLVHIKLILQSGLYPSIGPAKWPHFDMTFWDFIACG